MREAPSPTPARRSLACTGQTVRFDGSGSTDADGAVNAFSWNFGDGSSGGGERPTHVFERPGNYTRHPHHHRRRPRQLQRARHRRHPGDRGRGPAHRHRRPRPRRRRRAATALRGPPLGPGRPFRRQLRLGLRRRRRPRTGPSVEHAFAEPGTATVTLRAVLPGASEGCGTIETRRLVTVNAPPAPVVDAPDRVAAGGLVLFDASASTRPRRRITGYAWDFGDGMTATGVQAQHRFAEAGTYTVSLAATDDAGVANSRRDAHAARVEVTPPPRSPTSASPPPLCPGVPHAWTVAEDADGR